VGRRGLSFEQVLSAHDALVTAGFAPSVRNLRERLGNTGSLTTIAEHLRRIQTQLTETPGPALPDPMVSMLLKGASSYWRELAEAADASVELVRQEAAAEVSVAHGERDAAYDLAARSADELGAAHAALHRQEVQARDDVAELQRLTGERDAADVASASAQASADLQRAERQACERELASLGDTLAAERADARTHQRELLARANRLETALEAARVRHETLQQSLTIQLDERNVALSTQQTARALSEERAEHLESRIASSDSDLAQAHRQLSTLRARLAELIAERDALATERDTLTTQNRVTERRALDHEAHANALLERLADDARPDRVLALLESLNARLTDREDVAVAEAGRKPPG